MWILGIETSTRIGSLALLNNGKIINEITLNIDTSLSSNLLLALDTILKFSKINIKYINGVAVCVGPGSFTGVRIGIGTTMGIARALKIPCTGISTLEILANNLWGVNDYICPILKARNGEIYTALYEKSEFGLVTINHPIVIQIENFIPFLDKHCNENKKIFFIGDGVEACHKIIISNLEKIYEFVPDYLNSPRAGVLADLALKKLENKNNSNNIIEDINPLYCRKFGINNDMN
ncbi:tRNA (adenosine(37)-N6)-threonylcarbamoyltransferase complex dimerization subunit type 1 TsaB [Candidatus Poribacteria bacterium]|nr:tRNA (adenosine(37)-N6)-threonylcarbamoyltransferase complex dimerization subunit type 1 TsaB [Candidatus Poribacteria bacterium]